MEERIYPAAAVERAMKVQEVIMRAMAKRITWWQAAEILGVSPRTMRRMRREWEKVGYDGLFDRRKKQPSPKRVPVAELERVLELYQRKYFDFSVRHFHEKLAEDHQIHYSYTWVKTALQSAGLVGKRSVRGPHRKRRPRRPVPGMLLHIDGSRHKWFPGRRPRDLIVILDDATSEIYYAQLVEAESTVTIMAAIRHVVETQGWFASLYSDRASHFFHTPKEGGPVDTRIRTQVGRALKELDIEPIPAYSPQARGRSERNFGTWQGRLPQELRIRGIRDMEEANRFLSEHYIDEFNRKFTVPAPQEGTAFVPLSRTDLDRVFSVHHERIVNRDNTIQFANLVLQVPPTRFRATLAGCRVQVYEHLSGVLSIGYGPHTVARFSPRGEPVPLEKTPTVSRPGARLRRSRTTHSRDPRPALTRAAAK